MRAARIVAAAATLCACVWNVAGPDAKSVLTRTIAYTSPDPRVQAAAWIMDHFATAETSRPAHHQRPILVASPYYFRYFPPLAFDAETYSRLRDQARASGGEGGYFDRAARYAAEDRRTTVSATFLDIKTSFRRLPDGAREFDPQPFALDSADYTGRFSLVIVPGNTRHILDLDLPELAPLNRLLRHLTSGRKLADFAPRTASSAPAVEIFEAP